MPSPCATSISFRWPGGGTQLERGRREVMLLPGHEDGVLAGGVRDDLDGALGVARVEVAR